ncbi:YgeY family selenium metabolism-linked hydrolase [Anaerocolumna sp. MB42-C2]|uniref:YgeY family selenium metabolism-linked hydrolase n=1 Tax=Anaerocolumna sp. MB42-C2 TaxID=3070997 RepID=UPI0027DF7404|nr:YgeY family selenium metabolism-linked hydrolase [Anaerocolumna sp. MB42-C2]WMJ90323.1 YgeY family selenium metabolism-linked hydrolase [Anaerocolumna sp. MB42-C2]
MLAEDEKKELIYLCQALIRERSYSGEEKGVSELLKDFMTEHGYDDIYVDKYGNTIGHIKGKKPGPKLLFDGHMDTVIVTQSEKWICDPFFGVIQDGKLYGRGSSDMKGALSAMVYAAYDFAKETDKNFAGDIYVAGVVHEECFEGVAAREVSAYVKPDYVIIGEASGLNLKIGQRGRAEIIVETYGTPAHSANPEKGNNAVYQMGKVIEVIQAIKPTEHPVLGKGILELTDIKSEPYPGASVVPEYCRATYDRRLLVGETKESVLAPIQNVLEQLMNENKNITAKVSYAVGKEQCYTGQMIEEERFFPGWLFEASEPYIQDIWRELKANGYNPEITQYNFCTNGSHYAGEAGIKTIGLGPSRENLAHTIGEYIELDQLVKAADCYKIVMKALLK